MVTEPLVSPNSALLWGEWLHQNKMQTITLNPKSTKLSTERLKLIKYIRVRPLQKCVPTVKCKFEKGNDEKK
jgi:hypothetical protein